jgi:hypothetical protein
MQVVNGFVCRDCTDVDRAKKGIDPAHPKDGPYRADKKREDKRIEEKQEVEKAKLATTGTVGTRLDVTG